MPIAFLYARNGELQFSSGETAVTPIYQLGALDHAETQAGMFATNLEGMCEADAVAETALIGLACHIQTIGELLSLTEIHNVSERALNDVGLLVQTLGSQVSSLLNLRIRLADSIKIEEKAERARKGGAA